MPVFHSVRHQFLGVCIIVILNRGLSSGILIAFFDRTPGPAKYILFFQNRGFKKKEWKDTRKITLSTPSVVFTAQVNVTPPTATKLVAIKNALAARKAVDWFI